MKKMDLKITLKDLWYVCWHHHIFVRVDGKLAEVLDGRDGPVVNGEYRCDDLVKEINVDHFPNYGKVMVVTLKD